SLTTRYCVETPADDEYCQAISDGSPAATRGIEYRRPSNALMNGTATKSSTVERSRDTNAARIDVVVAAWNALHSLSHATRYRAPVHPRDTSRCAITSGAGITTPLPSSTTPSAVTRLSVTRRPPERKQKPCSAESRIEATSQSTPSEATRGPELCVPAPMSMSALSMISPLADTRRAMTSKSRRPRCDVQTTR